MADVSGVQLSFQFQLGLVRDRVTVDSSELNLKSLKSLACDFIAEKHPANGITRLPERILLFRHCYDSSNILQVSPKITDCARCFWAADGVEWGSNCWLC